MNKRLKEIRTRQGLTQTQMAEKMGFTHPAYNRLETGKAPLNERHYLLLSSLFGINEEWLKTGKGKMYDTKSQQTNKFIELYDQLPEYCQNYIIDNMKRMLEEFPSDDKPSEDNSES